MTSTTSATSALVTSTTVSEILVACSFSFIGCDRRLTSSSLDTHIRLSVRAPLRGLDLEGAGFGDRRK